MNEVALKNIIKWILPLLIVNQVEAQNSHVIYGLDKAQYFHATDKGPFIVQAGAFLSEPMALQLKKNLAENGHYPIKVHFTGQFYTVLIGPISSADAVRAIGANIAF